MVEKKVEGKETKKFKEVAPTPLTIPYREIKETKTQPFLAYLANLYPNLKKELKIASINKEPEDFIKDGIIFSFFLATFISLSTLYIFLELKMDIGFIVFSFLFSFVLTMWLGFYTHLYKPRLIIKQKERKIDKELVFCGRHLLIELRAGMTLFDALVGVSQGYGEVSEEFKKITEKITLGVPATVAIFEVAQQTPSTYLKRVLLQLANTLTSGADIADSLEAVLDQISQEQIIKLKEYGQKLNPLAMFYMVFGIILPSIGITFAIIVFSLLGSGIGITGGNLMFALTAFVLTIQFVFITMAENSRPAFYV
ncbi:MAG: type II secretion system F family protein [Candidatus Micrarchaeota archaeon]|nr:type II secretion system F family protein [Candidatus Micrarchaeota archaeon]